MNRDEALRRLDETFDVLVVGGGATGLGAALDSQARGYRTALVEASDFAKATSSRSTKLVHGGVRYLQNGDVGLVREALRERAVLRANAPHLVRELRFHLPLYRWYEGPYYFAGLKAYDALAGRTGFRASGANGAKATLRALPGLSSSGLFGSIAYSDGLFDDARLALALARTATDRGAAVVNYARVERLLYANGRACGAVVRDVETGSEREVRAKVVVNATGIFVDELRKADDPSARPLLEHSRGSHLVFSADVFPGDEALLVPKTDDGRVLFAIPWHGHVVVGTTDIQVDSAELDPAPTRAEAEYIVEHFNRYLARPVRASDALAAFAGLRPLVNRKNAGSTAKLSREHLVDISPHGLVTVTGGKWTTYRKMAEDTIDAAAREADLPEVASPTAHVPLHGNPGPSGRFSDEAHATYGTDRDELFALEAGDADLRAPLSARLPFTRAQAAYAISAEMARTVDDVLSRRMRATFLDAAAAREAAPWVAARLARELGRDDAWRDAELAAFSKLVRSDEAAFVAALA